MRIMDGTLQQEQALHRHLKIYATPSREWYYPCPEVRNMLDYVEIAGMGCKVEDLISGLVSGRFRRST